MKGLCADIVKYIIFTADRAKQIKTKAMVNEDPTDALIRDLREQNEALKAMLASGNVDMAQYGGTKEMSEEELETIKEAYGNGEARLMVGFNRRFPHLFLK